MRNPFSHVILCYAFHFVSQTLSFKVGTFFATIRQRMVACFQGIVKKGLDHQQADCSYLLSIPPQHKQHICGTAITE